MEVMAGYKQTEGGIIPEDWEMKRLGDECELVTKGTTPTSLGKDFTDSGINFIKVETLDASGKIVNDRVAYIDEETHKLLKRSQLREGDLLISIAGALGRTGIVEKKILPANTNQALAIVRLKSNAKLNLFYVTHYLKSAAIKKHIEGISVQGAQANLSLQNIAELPIYAPDLSEQQAIAEVLSDADALIEALEQLIAKKRQVKQGAMQELLTGKRRLPVFTDKWKVKKLGELCTAIMDGTHFTPKYVSDGIPFYSVENVTANNFSHTKFISLQEHNRLIKRCKPEKGDILMTRIGSLGDTKLIDWDVNASIYVSLALLKVNKQAINGNYLYAYTKSRKFIKDVELRSLINAIPQKINMENIGQVPILVPSPEEQTANAEILSDMDAEIAALEGKLSKARQVKQGMMQELLTGRVRLVTV